MKTYIVKPNQTLMDTVLQICGTLEGVMAVAIENDLSVSDFVLPGQLLKMPADIVASNPVLTFTGRNSYVFGTAHDGIATADYLIDETGTYIPDESGEVILLS